MKIKLYQYDYEGDREVYTKILFGDTPTQEDVKSIYLKTIEIAEIKNEHVLKTEHLDLCEAMFRIFNSDDRPNGKFVRSMSVGDIVSIDNTNYICSSFGFNPIEVDLSLVSNHENIIICDDSIF